ncbi:MAG: PAS domain S-box protein [Desulfobulbaceae bacterium]|nr:PAS domain S-box protein [Desulfobulbaceae bacterium]
MHKTPDLNIPQLLEGIPHAAMILDQRFHIVSMNRLMEAMTGRSTKDVAGVHGELVVRSNTGNVRGQLYSECMQSGEAVTIRGDVLNGNRLKVPVQYTVSALTNQEGDRCGLLVLAEDISSYNKTDQDSSLESTSKDLIGYSPKMQKVFELIPLISQTDASVMITGETGTGKDKIAEIIHRKSSRARFPFVKVNCGALPSGLLESELFGHVKGAFTGATRNKAGMFKLAHKGTLFLTEIGDMELPLQVKLLTVLDDKTFTPVGGEQKISVDVRIIAATHRPLREQIQNNEFREDLFYRLHVLHAHLPPLREREEDIRYLLDHFLGHFSKALSKPQASFASGAMELLLTYQYPGNIRELKNIVEYSVNICKSQNIGREVLPPYLFEAQPPFAENTESASSQSVNTKMQGITGLTDNQSWESIEREMIVDMLLEHGGSRLKTAASLGWGRMKLWRKMKSYGLL